MSKYLSILETHLAPEQNGALALVVEAAARLDVNLFITGGTMRDVFAGIPANRLDFAVEGSAAKLAHALVHAGSAELVHTDEGQRYSDVRLGLGVRSRIMTARDERYTKPGAKPHITPATIHEHLRSRDFSVNSIALSLTRASRGLLLDPNNGVADIANRELRAISNHVFLDQPVRLLELNRLRVRLGFGVFLKTETQYESALAAAVERLIRPEALLDELRRTALEPKALEVLQAWNSAGLLDKLLPAIAGARLNLAGFTRLQKARQAIPFGVPLAVDEEALFFWTLTEKLTPKERNAFADALGIDRQRAAAWLKLEAHAAKVEKALAAGSVNKPSQVYRVLTDVPGEIAIFLLTHSSQRVVQDRVRNYFSRYLPAALEVEDKDVPVAAGSPRFQKLKSELIARRLDARPKRPPAPTPLGTPAPAGETRATSRIL